MGYSTQRIYLAPKQGGKHHFVFVPDSAVIAEVVLNGVDIGTCSLSNAPASEWLEIAGLDEFASVEQAYVEFPPKHVVPTQIINGLSIPPPSIKVKPAVNKKATNII